MENNSFSKLALKNTFYNSLGWIWPIGLNLITTPYVVLSLGKDAYGILGLIGVILGYFALLDMGIGAGNIKYVSEYLIKNEYKKINYVINSLFLICLAIGLIALLSIVLLSNWLAISVFKVPENLQNTAIFAFRIAAIGFPFGLLNNVFGAIPKAFHRFDIHNKIQLVIGTFSILSIVFIIFIGYGFKEVVLVKFLNSALYLIVNGVVVKKLLPTYKLRLTIEKSIFKKLFSFGVWDLFIKLSNLSIGQFGRMMIGIMLGTTAITYYYVPQSLTARINSFTFKLSEIIFPITSQLSTQNNYERLRKIYIKMTRYFLMFKLSVYIPLCVMSYKILEYWIGKDFADNGYMVLVILAIGFFVNSLGHLPGLITYGVAKLRITSVYTIINFVLLAVFIYPLIKAFGIVGASLAYAISTIPFIHFLFYVNKKVLMLSNFQFMAETMLKPVVIGVAQLFFVYALSFYANNIALVIVFLILTFLFYHILGFIWGAYEKQEKEILLNIIYKYIKRKA